MRGLVVIHQPDFLSYLGFFHRFLFAKMWIVLDTVQYVAGTANSWHNRDKIRTAQGERWLTVSVQKPSFGTAIKDVLLSGTDWRRDNLNLIMANYGKAPYFEEIIPYIQRVYAYECSHLADFNLNAARIILELFDIRIEIVLASTLAPSGSSNELLVDLLRKVKAERYLSGTGARAYFRPEPFDQAGIEVVWQEFRHPVYPQQFEPFIPYLSCIDLLFNCGIERSRNMLRSCS